MGHFSVKADAVRNRLYVTMGGFANDAEMQDNVRRVEAELPKLRPGFAMVSTLADMKATSAGGAKSLQHAMELYKKHGIARIVRVVGNEVLGKMQLNRISQEAGIPVDYVSSLEAAEQLLSAKASGR